MAETIENDAHIFWDINMTFPGKCVGDAFEEAGGQVDYDGTFVYVRGLDFDIAKKIARDWQADYIGPVKAPSADPETLKDVTPKAVPVFSR